MADPQHTDTILKRLAFEGYIVEPTYESFRASPHSPQWRIRQGKPPKSEHECVTATLEALILQGGVDAWDGDGVSCVAQMIWAQHRRAEALQAKVDQLNAVLFEPEEADASYNLQGVAHDLKQFDPDDGGVIARTVDRVISQIETARTVING